jgi:predicted dehydrogenase
MKLLVVGTKFGSTYLDAAKQSANWEIAGIVAQTQESLDLTGKKFDIDERHRYRDLKSALNGLPDVDAVAITVPNALHYQFASEVLKANKHLILEKPIVETWDEAVGLIKLLDAQPGVKAMVGQTLRGVPMIRLMEHFLNKGIIGEIEQMTFSSHWWWVDDPMKSWRFRLPDMYLDDIGIHQFDEIRMLLNNRKCKKVMAKSWNPPSYPIPIRSSASAIMTFENEIPVNYFASQSTRGESVGWFGRVEIFGSKGELIRDSDKQPYVILEGSNKKVGLDDEYGEQLDELLPLIEYEKIAYLLEDFYLAIKDNRPPITDLHDNLNTFAILQAVKRSAELHTEVNVQEVFPLP